MSRVLKTGTNQVTQSYFEHTGWSKGVDVVKQKNSLDYIIAHTTGRVIKTMVGQVNGKLDPEGYGYGNYVMIAHNNGYVTVYAHLEKVSVSVGQIVPTGATIGFMGNTGNSFGAHLHFEVRKYNENPLIMAQRDLNNTKKFTWLNPTPFLDADLPEQKVDVTYRVQVGAYLLKFNAKNMANKLAKDGYSSICKYYDKQYHVQVGAYSSKENAEKMASQLQAKGYKTFITTENGTDVSF